LLRPGTYTIVPQSVAGSSRLPKVVVFAIDARGIRPSAPVRWRNCEQAAIVPLSRLVGVGPVAGDTLPDSTSRRSDVAAAESASPAQRDRPAEKGLAVAGSGLLPRVQESSLLTALLIAQLAVALALLAAASLGSNGATMRFRSGQAVARHRPQIAAVGGALLVGTGLLFLLVQLTS
jgi:hypothetical protein